MAAFKYKTVRTPTAKVFLTFQVSTPVLTENVVSRARERHDELRLEKLVRREQTRASETYMATRAKTSTQKTIKFWIKVELPKRENEKRETFLLKSAQSKVDSN